MRKQFAILLSLVLCLALTALPAYAEDAESEVTSETRTLVITSAEEFLAFAENCRLDSYSLGLTVRLECDIDLTGIDWEGVPVFCGSFDGGGHTVSGLSVTNDGSRQGLFRMLTQTASIEHLTVTGTVAPGGSRAEVGGIAGRNAGRIADCVFEGSIAGAESVGGAVGVNEVTGVVENVTVRGTVGGSHFVGGVAGENSGVLRNCVNEADVNTTEQQNKVNLSDITLETLTGSEDANSATDVGGIAGTSSGVVRNCINRGGVGYRQMGLNVGGIAGSQSGYIEGCVNSGEVLGRKDVGGIVGQLEPVTRVTFEEDTFQILQGQLDDLNSLTNQASAHAQNSTSTMSSGIASLQSQTDSAKQAASALVPEEGQLPSLPDVDSVTAAKNDLASRVSTMNQTVADMASAAQSTAGALSSDMQAITEQMNVINATLGSARDTLGGSFTDVSDEDTDSDLSAKVENCVNEGSVSGDWDCGGIAGMIAPETDVDTLDDVELSGEESLHFEGELRAVVLRCENSGNVAAGKENAGGITGWAAMGLVKASVNTGNVGEESADCVGGIAGRSAAFLRGNSAKCRLSGASGVGGIAGEGTIAADCRSMVRIESASEQYGAVFGRQADTEETDPLRGNFYLPVDGDVGAVDGVSYDGMAQPLGHDAFLSLEDLPDAFRTVTLRFVSEDGAVQMLTTEPGGSIDPSLVPEVLQKEGYTGVWEGLDAIDWNNIDFDETFYASYAARDTVLSSDAVREESGQPVLLVQGVEGTLSAKSTDDKPETDGVWIETWMISTPDAADELTVRYLPPEDFGTEEITVLVLSDGVWREAEASVDGSRLVFHIEPGEAVFAAVEIPDPIWPYVCGAAVFTVAAVCLYIARRRHRCTQQSGVQ